MNVVSIVSLFQRRGGREINFVPEKGRVIRENNGKNEYCFLQSGIHVTVCCCCCCFFFSLFTNRILSSNKIGIIPEQLFANLHSLLTL